MMNTQQRRNQGGSGKYNITGNVIKDWDAAIIKPFQGSGGTPGMPPEWK